MDLRQQIHLSGPAKDGENGENSLWPVRIQLWLTENELVAGPRYAENKLAGRPERPHHPS